MRHAAPRPILHVISPHVATAAICATQYQFTKSSCLLCVPPADQKRGHDLFSSEKPQDIAAAQEEAKNRILRKAFEGKDKPL